MKMKDTPHIKDLSTLHILISTLHSTANPWKNSHLHFASKVSLNKQEHIFNTQPITLLCLTNIIPTISSYFSLILTSSLHAYGLRTCSLFLLLSQPLSPPWWAGCSILNVIKKHGNLRLRKRPLCRWPYVLEGLAYKTQAHLFIVTLFGKFEITQLYNFQNHVD